ncbi:MAG: LytTR family transcriptional regulator [Clostridia bacterium]|nr:LytTR family transcriptional regulator [Clostridia bacterium]
MKCTVILDKNREEEIVIYAKEENDIIKRIKQLAADENKEIYGFLREEIVRLELNNVYCFSLEGGKLYAMCEKEKYLIKARLYNIEEKLNENFIKINQSSIANIQKIQKFDASIGGALMVVFKNGHTDYVSRRNIKFVKERLGL